MEKIIKNKISKINQNIFDFKSKQWKVQKQQQEYERKRTPLKEFEGKKSYMKRIEKVYIYLIKLISQREILQEVLSELNKNFTQD